MVTAGQSALLKLLDGKNFRSARSPYRDVSCRPRETSGYLEADQEFISERIPISKRVP